MLLNNKCVGFCFVIFLCITFVTISVSLKMGPGRLNPPTSTTDHEPPPLIFMICGDLPILATLGKWIDERSFRGVVIAGNAAARSLRARRPRLIIDHDGGADDAMAILMAILYEKYFEGPEIIGLTTNHGNVREDQVFINSQRILDVAQRRDIPIFRGSNNSLIDNLELDYYFGIDGLGDSDYHSSFDPIPAQSDHAVNYLINASKVYEGDLIVVCIGPLSNLALAVRMDPKFIGRLAQLYIGAGHLHDANHPAPEFNAYMDAEAYHVVVENALPDLVTIVPFSRTNSSMKIARDWRLEVLGGIDTEIMRSINAFENSSSQNFINWIELDPAVMAVALDDSLVTETKHSNNRITLCGDKRGLNTNTIGLKETANVRMMYSMDENRFKQLLLDIFSSEL